MYTINVCEETDCSPGVDLSTVLSVRCSVQRRPLLFPARRHMTTTDDFICRYTDQDKFRSPTTVQPCSQGCNHAHPLVDRLGDLTGTSELSVYYPPLPPPLEIWLFWCKPVHMDVKKCTWAGTGRLQGRSSTSGDFNAETVQYFRIILFCVHNTSRLRVAPQK